MRSGRRAKRILVGTPWGVKRLFIGIGALAIAAACTRIVQKPPGSGGSGGNGGNGGNGGSGGMPPPPTDLHIQALWSFNLPRSAVNLAPSYAAIHDGLTAALAQLHVIVDQEGVAPQYASDPRLIWGSSDRLHPSVDLVTTLRTSADSGLFEPPAVGTAPEQRALATLGQQFGNLTVPPELVGGDSVPLYGAPRDGLLIVTVHSTRRLCADTDPACMLSAQAPGDYFTATTPDGTVLLWIAPPSGSSGYAPHKVVFVDIVTSEGESPDAFRTRCAAVPGFSRNLLDVIEPSPAVYYDDLVPQLDARGPMATKIDLCEALGDNALSIARSTASAIAQRFASP